MNWSPFCSDKFKKRLYHDWTITIYISLYYFMYISQWFDFVMDKKWTGYWVAPLPTQPVCYCHQYKFTVDVFALLQLLGFYSHLNALETNFGDWILSVFSIIQYFSYSYLSNRRACTLIAGKVCLLASIKVKRQTLPAISILSN